MNYHASLDVSMRSTGIVILDDDGNLIDKNIVSNPDEDNEELLDKNSKDITGFLKQFELTTISYEGLSFQGKSAKRDLIDGNYWHLRWSLKTHFPHCDIFIIPVERWRKQVIPLERKRELKQLIKDGEMKKANWHKNECVRVLPDDIRENFEIFVEERKLKKGSIYDITDAYWLGHFIVHHELTNCV